MKIDTVHNIRRFDWVLKGLPVGPRDPFDIDLFDYRDVAVTPTVGAITEGWLLLVPREPTCCISNLANVTRERILDVAADVRGKMNVFPGTTVMFEHGARWSGSATGCGVDQAHLHMVNLENGFFESVLTHEPNIQWVQANPSDPWSALDRGREYYLIADFRSAFFSYSVTGESQYLRRAAARALSRSAEWDYRLFPNEQNARKTAELIKAQQRRKSAA